MACSTPNPPSTSATAASTGADISTGTSTSGGPGVTSPGDPDDFAPSDDGLFGCEISGSCNQLDILLVIDNSDGMAAEQAVLVASFPRLIQSLRELTDRDGAPIHPDVQIMVTTTDVGHPLCTPLQKPDYQPAVGAPIATACVDRLARFTSLDGGVVAPELCTDACDPDHPAIPLDPFIAFDADGSNVVGGDPNLDPVVQALRCIGPQGIDGCDMEAPLEATLQALNPNQPWNLGSRPFVRDGAALAIVIATDEVDCSVEDLAYFDPTLKDDPMVNQYWEVNPQTMMKDAPTSAVCFNAGVSCLDDLDGIYESCTAEDKLVLHPLTRYEGYLREVLLHGETKEVVVLGLLGVPEVTAHDPSPPHQPTAGGLADLVYRTWNAADIAPGDPDSPADKEYEFGIGPGCNRPATGPALPNTRVMDVCRALDTPDNPGTPNVDETRVRCIIESLCDSSYDLAVDLLVALLQPALKAPR